MTHSSPVKHEDNFLKAKEDNAVQRGLLRVTGPLCFQHTGNGNERNNLKGPQSLQSDFNSQGQHPAERLSTK